MIGVVFFPFAFAGLLVSITLPCFYKGEFIGVTGTDINMEDLTSDISLFNQGHSAYAFMTSRSGRTIVHPLLPAPTSAYGDPVYLDIRALESEPEFNDVFDSMTMYECLSFFSFTGLFTANAAYLSVYEVTSHVFSCKMISFFKCAHSKEIVP